ncbi:MAG: NIPSNAP family protein, partial [Chloroflexi bacterium]|nr:NIPSNAP family protein [Chloroflexota bacterium]
MLYELRAYEAVPARLNALVERFSQVNIRLFQRHGFRPMGYWTEQVGTPHRLVYLLAWETWEERERAWAAFYADPEWQRSL